MQEPFQYLLNTHWCWIQPLFNFIYRPAFTRDMQLLGPYYSHTLLNAILSHSVRWGRWDKVTRERLGQEYDGGAVFGRHARTMVFDEVSRGVATIPTVQTLLLLSAQECSQGDTSQAWMYSGMAFRMIDHLGICVDSQSYDGDIPFSDEDVEIRRRLFWSCYFWDKIISLYLGRSPTLQHSTVSPPQMMRMSSLPSLSSDRVTLTHIDRPQHSRRLERERDVGSLRAHVSRRRKIPTHRGTLDVLLHAYVSTVCYLQPDSHAYV